MKKEIVILIMLSSIYTMNEKIDIRTEGIRVNKEKNTIYFLFAI